MNLKSFDKLIEHLPRIPGWIWLIVYFVSLGVISDVVHDGLFLIAAIGLGMAFRYTGKRQKFLRGQKLAKRIQQLKDTVQIADKQSKLLNQYLIDKDTHNFQLVANQLLPKLDFIKEESYQLQGHIPSEVYKRINHKADQVRVDTVLQLEQVEIDSHMSQQFVIDKIITEQVPEIQEIYQNVLRDNKTILEKIEAADNKAELTALQESSMDHFYDILNGYLKIKSSPKDYYKAEERLASALQALKQFDLDLDETLRKLNESELKDFDVSLRMMQDKSKQNTIAPDLE